MNDSYRTNLDTPAWIAQTWVAFGISMVLMAVGIWYLPVDIWQRAFLATGFFFTVATSFTLAKTIRDNHEAKKMLSRVKDVRTEKLLAEYAPAES